MPKDQTIAGCEVEQFIANLADACRRGDRLIRVLVTMRADFLDRCLTFPALRDLLQGGQYLLGPMTGPALREAIVRPGREAGAYFEKGLVGMILREVEKEPGALPLLQHAAVRIGGAPAAAPGSLLTPTRLAGACLVRCSAVPRPRTMR